MEGNEKNVAEAAADDFVEGKKDRRDIGGSWLWNKDVASAIEEKCDEIRHRQQQKQYRGRDTNCEEEMCCVCA